MLSHFSTGQWWPLAAAEVSGGKRDSDDNMVHSQGEVSAQPAEDPRNHSGNQGAGQLLIHHPKYWLALSPSDI